MDGSRPLLTAHFWLRPRLHELLTSIAGGPYHFDPRDSIGTLARQCLRRDAARFDHEFAYLRKRFDVKMTFKQSRRYGAWVHRDGLVRFENMAQNLFDQMLFSHVQASLQLGQPKDRSIRAFMDHHDIGAEHTDYRSLRITFDRMHFRRTNSIPPS